MNNIFNISKFNKKKLFELLDKKNKSKRIVLSEAFGSFCEKIQFDKNQQFVVKGYRKKNNQYNAIFYEGKSLKFLHEKFPKLFPKIYYIDKNLFVMQYIPNNKIKNNISEKDLAIKISKIHKNTNDKFGFEFDTPVGGFRQPCKFQKSWVDFFEKKRLFTIFNKINTTNPMPKQINIGIEKLLKKLKDLIPDNPQPSLIHGDLWSGNMLFNDGKLVGLVDPGIYYAPKEMEIAYLKWFNAISNNFYNYYSETISFDKDFFNYSEVYELYYSLLNVYLWDRNYINDVARLVNKFN